MFDLTPSPIQDDLLSIFALIMSAKTLFPNQVPPWFLDPCPSLWVSVGPAAFQVLLIVRPGSRRMPEHMRGQGPASCGFGGVCVAAPADLGST